VPVSGDSTILLGDGTYARKTRLYAADGVTPLLPDAAAPAPGTAYGTLTKIMSVPMLDNGATLDPSKGSSEATLLASAARTGTTTTADQQNVDWRGAIAWLNVTAASGTGGLVLRWAGKDPISGTYTLLNSAPTAVIATGMVFYVIYPTSYANSNATQAVAYPPLPRTWRIQVTHGDGSSYTYSVGLSLLK
jgi:hypothetical protein